MCIFPTDHQHQRSYTAGVRTTPQSYLLAVVRTPTFKKKVVTSASLLLLVAGSSPASAHRYTHHKSAAAAAVAAAAGAHNSTTSRNASYASDRRGGSGSGEFDHPFKMDRPLNVFGRPLTQCGTNPMTGFYRDGVSHNISLTRFQSWQSNRIVLTFSFFCSADFGCNSTATQAQQMVDRTQLQQWYRRNGSNSPRPRATISDLSFQKAAHGVFASRGGSRALTLSSAVSCPRRGCPRSSWMLPTSAHLLSYR